MIHGKIKQCIQAGIMGAVMLAAFPACTDDHFDVRDGGGVGENATATLWEQIKASPDLSNFTSIVEQTPAFKDEKHPIKDYTFKDVLSSNQILTVFAPTNDAFTAADVHFYDSLVKVRPYDVYLRLVGNHIARNRYVATGQNPDGKPERIIMVNNKKGYFDRLGFFDRTMNPDVKTPLAQSNIPATNGVLHKLGIVSPFAYNVYEYIRANDAHFRHLNSWIEQHDTLYFNAELSAEAGANPVTGEPIYVDSVYTRSNSLYSYSYSPRSEEWVMPHKGVSANLEAEDSIWAVLLPTDAAWEEAYADMKDEYIYANTYVDKTLEDALVKDDPAAKRAMTLTVTDSLNDIAFNMDMVSPMVFNVRMQKRIPEQPTFWTLETFQQYDIVKLFNTRSDTVTVDEKATENVKPLIFDGKQPVNVSNGVVYPVDHWNYPRTWGYKDVEVKASRRNIFQNVRYNLNAQEQKERTYNSDFEVKSFNSETSALANDSALGKVSKNTFMTFSRSTGTPIAEFILKDDEQDRQIRSNIPYDIYIVMVPDFYRADPDSIVAMVPGETPFKKNKLQVQVNRLTEDGKEQLTGANDMRFDYDGEKVDTVYAGSITFPYSYRNLVKSYPTLTIKSQTISNAQMRDGYQRTFSIDRIILRARSKNE
ncbi:MAG: fasciclin domain-containing protein [Bacteroidaceae bacterium]|nr:fasciclin domain-containing protein [Bacteroidaceae bacterium]